MEGTNFDLVVAEIGQYRVNRFESTIIFTSPGYFFTDLSKKAGFNPGLS